MFERHRPARGSRPPPLSCAAPVSVAPELMSRLEPETDKRLLLVGTGRVIEVARRALEQAGAHVEHLRAPTDRDLHRALEGRPFESVLLVGRDDRALLRQALLVEESRPGLSLVVTIYNRDLGAQLRRSIECVRVLSMADAVAPALAAACLGEDLLWVGRDGERSVAVRLLADRPALAPVELVRHRLATRLRANLGSLLHPFELSARTLLIGIAGFFGVLAAETLTVALARAQGLVAALYESTKEIVTVGPDQAVDHGPAWLKLFSVATMLAALAFGAIFTAGLIERLLDRRLVAMLGRRALPRRAHVVVVGLGQVGLRLCMMLRSLAVPVLAVERDPHADNIRRARQYEIPVVIGRGSSRGVLSRLSLGRARTLAAVTSDEIENVAAVMAAKALNGGLATVLRAGGGETSPQTRALLRIGAVQDVYLLGGGALAALALGRSPRGVFALGEEAWALSESMELMPLCEYLGAAASSRR